MLFSRNLTNQHENVPVWFFANACFVSKTILSACPFLTGWYGAFVIYVTPFLLRKALTYDETKDGPTSQSFQGCEKVPQFLIECD